MKKCFAIVLAAALTLGLAACGNGKESEEYGEAERAPIRVCVLTGPTGVGAVDLWNRSENDETLPYSFSAAVSGDEAIAKFSGGEADIIAVSTNLAAKLYKKTGGKVKILAANTLGVLSVLQNSPEQDGSAAITSLKDLKGRKVVTIGQGANPEYIIEHLLRKNGIGFEGTSEDDVTLEFKADASALTAVWAAEPDAVIIAPAPASSAICMKYPGSKKVLDLSDEWDKVNNGFGLMMGCLIASSDFCESHKTEVNDFLREYEDSIAAVTADPQAAGVLCEKYGMSANAALAEKAIPDCHLCCITGSELKYAVTTYFQILYDADPSSIGAMPDDGIWY